MHYIYMLLFLLVTGSLFSYDILKIELIPLSEVYKQSQKSLNLSKAKQMATTVLPRIDSSVENDFQVNPGTLKTGDRFDIIVSLSFSLDFKQFARIQQTVRKEKVTVDPKILKTYTAIYRGIIEAYGQVEIYNKYKVNIGNIQTADFNVLTKIRDLERKILELYLQIIIDQAELYTLAGISVDNLTGIDLEIDIVSQIIKTAYAEYIK